jgi:hypothetical protein
MRSLTGRVPRARKGPPRNSDEEAKQHHHRGSRNRDAVAVRRLP